MTDDIDVANLNRQVYLLEQKCARMQEALEAIYSALDTARDSTATHVVKSAHMEAVKCKVFAEDEDA